MLIRTATIADAPAIASILRQLGYDNGVGDIVARLELLSRTDDEAVFLAVDEQRLMGCLAAHVHDVLHASGRWGRITALVIDAAARGRGVGRALVAECTAFFRSRDCVRIEVTSAEHRSGAHGFYRALGYREVARHFITKPEL